MTTKRTGTSTQRVLRWPEDPENVEAADIDFEALAHVLANTCRSGGCCRHYHSIAAHAAIVSEEVEALDGLGAGDRRTLALHALVAGAASAWFRGAWFRGESAGSARAAERTARLAARIEGAVRQAAGLDTVLDEEHAELLRFVERIDSRRRAPRPVRGRKAARDRLPAAQAPHPPDPARPCGGGLARPLPGARRGSERCREGRRERRRRYWIAGCDRGLTSPGGPTPDRCPGQAGQARGR